MKEAREEATPWPPMLDVALNAVRELSDEQRLVLLEYICPACGTMLVEDERGPRVHDARHCVRHGDRTRVSR